MNSKLMLSTALAAGIIALSAPAWAELGVLATTDLNVRAGPGPNYPIVNVIAANDSAVLLGCIPDSQWCHVSYGGMEGWAYSAYLVADASGTAVVIADADASVSVPVVGYDGPAPETAADVVVGALLAPVEVAGALVQAIAEVPQSVHAHIASHPVDTVYLDGEVVVGASIPEPVALHEIPDYQYRYVYVNDVPVLVDSDRRIVYVVRG